MTQHSAVGNATDAVASLNNNMNNDSNLSNQAVINKFIKKRREILINSLEVIHSLIQSSKPHDSDHLLFNNKASPSDVTNYGMYFHNMVLLRSYKTVPTVIEMYQNHLNQFASENDDEISRGITYRHDIKVIQSHILIDICKNMSTIWLGLVPDDEPVNNTLISLLQQVLDISLALDDQLHNTRTQLISSDGSVKLLNETTDSFITLLRIIKSNFPYTIKSAPNNKRMERKRDDQVQLTLSYLNLSVCELVLRDTQRNQEISAWSDDHNCIDYVLLCLKDYASLCQRTGGMYHNRSDDVSKMETEDITVDALSESDEYDLNGCDEDDDEFNDKADGAKSNESFEDADSAPLESEVTADIGCSTLKCDVRKKKARTDTKASNPSLQLPWKVLLNLYASRLFRCLRAVVVNCSSLDDVKRFSDDGISTSALKISYTVLTSFSNILQSIHNIVHSGNVTNKGDGTLGYRYRLILRPLVQTLIDLTAQFNIPRYIHRTFFSLTIIDNKEMESIFIILLQCLLRISDMLQIIHKLLDSIEVQFIESIAILLRTLPDVSANQLSEENNALLSSSMYSSDLFRSHRESR
jgi:hypothetical protein